MERKRLLYVPGLISLLLLPVILLLFGPGEKARPTAIRFFLPKDNTEPEPNLTFSKYSVNQALKKKKIITVRLWDKYFEDDSPLYYGRQHFIEQEIAKLQYLNDTTTALNIELGDENTYEEFIWILNMAMLYKIKRYAWVDDNFYLLANEPPYKRASDIQLDVIPYLVSTDNEPSKWDIFKTRLNDLWLEARYILKHNYLIVSGFILLILLPGIIRIIKK